MENALRALLLMVKCSLTDTKASVPETVDMTAVRDLAVRHQMEGLAYDGALRCGMDKHEPAVRSLFHLFCKVSAKSQLQMEHLQLLFAAFDEAGIDYLPLKGSVLKQMYPTPELRSMSDADILIRLEQYDKIEPLMERLGYRFLAQSDCELKWASHGLYVELHKRMIPSFVKDLYAYFGDGWQLACSGEGNRWQLSPEDEYLFIFAHFARHYREGAAEIRHMTDIWYYRKKMPQLDEEKLCSALRKMSLETFYTNVQKTLANWFEDGEETAVTKQITDYILSSCTHGEKSTKAVAEGLRNTKGKGRYAAAVQAVFPPLSSMRCAYPVLQKCPALLPMMWICRGFRLVFLQRDRLAAGRRRLAAMDMEKIGDFERSLREVGLGMEFEER